MEHVVVKQMPMSATYRQSVKATDEKQKKDLTISIYQED
jgi:hypothetical protein